MPIFEDEDIPKMEKLMDEETKKEYLAKKKLEAEGKGPKAPKLTEDPNAGAPKEEQPKKPKEDGDE